MTQITKTQLDMLHSLYCFGEKVGTNGVVMSSSWTTGSGRHTKQRAIPIFAEKVDCLYDKRASKGRIRKYLNRHPRVRYVVAITNMRAAKKALRDAGYIVD